MHRLFLAVRQLTLATRGALAGVGKSTIVTSLIKESYVAHVCRVLLGLLGCLTEAVYLGSTCSPRSHHSARGHTRKCYYVHRGLWMCVTRNSLLIKLWTLREVTTRLRTRQTPLGNRDTQGTCHLRGLCHRQSTYFRPDTHVLATILSTIGCECMYLISRVLLIPHLTPRYYSALHRFP